MYQFTTVQKTHPLQCLVFTQIFEAAHTISGHTRLNPDLATGERFVNSEQYLKRNKIAIKNKTHVRSNLLANRHFTLYHSLTVRTTIQFYIHLACWTVNNMIEGTSPRIGSLCEGVSEFRRMNHRTICSSSSRSGFTSFRRTSWLGLNAPYVDIITTDISSL